LFQILRIQRFQHPIHRCRSADIAITRKEVILLSRSQSGLFSSSVTRKDIDGFASFRAICLQNIGRLLELTEKYVSTVEESHPTSRTILPHGLSFKGEPLNLHIVAEESKTELDLQVTQLLRVLF